MLILPVCSLDIVLASQPFFFQQSTIQQLRGSIQQHALLHMFYILVMRGIVSIMEEREIVYVKMPKPCMCSPVPVLDVVP